MGRAHQARALLVELELFQFSEECGPADVEDLCGLVAVAVGLVEGTLDVVAGDPGIDTARAGKRDLAEELGEIGRAHV